MLIELFKEFQTWNPGIVAKMKECSHHFSPSHLNKWHLEDDVWTHTCLAYKELINCGCWSQKNQAILGISVLCHDIGKIYTRHSPKPGKIAMYNHSFASVQDTIQFIRHLRGTKFLSGLLINEVYYYVLNLVGNHMDFMMNPGKREALCNNDRYLYDISVILMNCDKNGSISTEKQEETNCHIKGEVVQLPDMDLGEIVFMCGPPASGKDTMADFSSSKNKIVSLDKVRMQVFEDSDDPGVYDTKEKYIAAFKYCNEKKIDLSSFLIDDIVNGFKEYSTVVISNTHLTRKLRMGIINQIKQKKELRDKKISAVYLCCDREELYKRDIERKDKTVGSEVIDKFLFNQQPPTADEGFNNIIYLEN